MSNKHIIDVIENAPFVSLSESELTGIRSHIADCANCRKAFAAAQVASTLLEERASETFEPSPFFQTRVLAALRDRQLVNEGWSLTRLWRTAGLLASSMAASVALLGVLTFAIPAGSQDVTATVSNYSAEDVILNQTAISDDAVSDGQILRTLYAEEEAAN